MNIQRRETFTWVILPKRLADERLRCGAIPAAALAFTERCNSNNRDDVFESQYAKTSLFS